MVVAVASFSVDSAVNFKDNKGFTPNFFRGEMVAIAESLPLGAPAFFAEKAFSSSERIGGLAFSRGQQAFTRELVNMPNMVAQWATHR